MGMVIKDSKELFEQYSQQYLKFNEAKEKEQIKKNDLKQLESQYNLVLDKENRFEKEKQELLQATDGDLQEAENSLRKEFQKQFDKAQKEYENAVVKITEKRDDRIAVNEERHFTGMAKFKEEGRILSKHNLSELDQKLYEFAAHKEEVLEAKLKKQNETEDLQNHINLETDKGLTLLQRKQNDIYKEYESIIEEKNNNMLAIEEKYFPGIQTAEEKIHSIERKYEEIISGINNQRSKEVELLVTDKKALEKQYKETDKRFKKQISVATKRNEPVAQLKAQHNAAIKSIQDAIGKKDSDINKLNFKYDKQVEVENGKRQKELNLSLQEKEKLVEAKNNELAGPQNELEKVTNERNLKLNNLETEKSGLEQQRGKALTEADTNLKTFLLEADNKLERIKRELIAFASTNGLAVEEKSAEAYEPFEYMESNLAVWMNVVSHFIPKFGERNAAIDSCRNTMETISYEEVVDFVNTSDNYARPIPFYLKNLKDKIIIAFAISILIGTILAFPLNMSVFIAYGVPVLVIGIYSFVSIKKKQELRNRCCELIFLTNNYKSIPQINERVQLLTDNATYEQVSEMADNIYRNVSGPELLQKKFENEERDIDNDYANECALAKERYEKQKEIITSEGRKRVIELRKKYADAQKSKSDKLDEINAQINAITSEKNKLDKEMEQIRSDLIAYKDVLTSFEESHMQFKKNLLHLSAPVEKTKGVLRDDVYLIPTDYKKCSDKNGHLPFMHIIHEKHPILIALDTQNIHKDGSYQEKLGTMVKTCLLDVALAFKNINGNEIIEQYIVDEISGGHELRADNYKNLLQIKKVTESVYDMQMYFSDFKKQREVFANKGITLSDYNITQTQKGERPGVYKICYIVLKNERCSGFSENITSLMKKGWDYGFVPIFICEKEIWESNKDKTGTVLNEISMNVTTTIKFNGKKYEELENE